MFQNLVSYMRRRLDDQGYSEVNAPQVLDNPYGKYRGIGAGTKKICLRLHRRAMMPMTTVFMP
ncbi:hypothetical protein BBC0178_012320 [Bartonella apihabitans]|uniref:Uncharacterized protein n=1 Tax=Bartonella apihabitans TaxID=2750929 RepID=A0A1U9MBL8_9HYPH|nr:hypothetical protein BBC0178_012320 [Bartonella apihabitans]